MPDVDPELAALVHALLAREAASRPPDAATVVERFTDIAARLRLAVTGTPPTIPASPAAGVVLPTIPLPNPSMLPTETWPAADPGG